jgi:hypothetical protein
VKKLAIVLLLVVSACRRQAVVTSAPATPRDPSTSANTADGGATPREALQRFLAAAKAQDIQAMSSIWGTKEGSARATGMPVQEMEQRLVYMAKCLRHDSYTVRGETAIIGGERQFTVELKYRRVVASDDFVVTPGPVGRWFVRIFDPAKLNAICAAA